MTALPATALAPRAPVFAAAAGELPTRTMIEGWDTAIAALAASAEDWRAAAGRIEDAADRYVAQMLAPGSTGWDGDAADTAQRSAYTDRGIVWGAADHIIALAKAADSGAQDLRAARARALEAITEAEADDFAVADDLTVTDRFTYTSDDWDLFAARQARAQEHQGYLAMRAGALAETDADVGARLGQGATELVGTAPQAWSDGAPRRPAGRFRFTDKDLYPHDPTAGDVFQNAIGDCYLDSTMGAIANANPQWIKDRISYDRTTGTFDVTLWDGRGWAHIPVTQDDIAADIAMAGASGRDNGMPHSALWPSVIECAYAKMNYPGRTTAEALGDNGIGRGGFSPDAMEALTGNRGTNIKPDFVWLTRRHLDQEITAALAQHQPVTLSTYGWNDQLVGSHVYVVESITGSGNDAVVTLRNPWQNNLGTPSDTRCPVITMRMDDLMGSGVPGPLGDHPVSDVTIGVLG